MDLNQVSQPTERAGISKRISDLWNSRNRIARLVIFAAAGLVLNCCCVIIPLSGKAAGLAAQANAGVNAISTPALTTAQDPFIPAAPAISAGTEFDNNGDRRVICQHFSSQAAARELAAHLSLDGSDMDGRSCKSLR